MSLDFTSLLFNPVVSFEHWIALTRMGLAVVLVILVKVKSNLAAVKRTLYCESINNFFFILSFLLIAYKVYQQQIWIYGEVKSV